MHDQVTRLWTDGVKLNNNSIKKKRESERQRELCAVVSGDRGAVCPAAAAGRGGPAGGESRRVDQTFISGHQTHAAKEKKVGFLLGILYMKKDRTEDSDWWSSVRFALSFLNLKSLRLCPSLFFH